MLEELKLKNGSTEVNVVIAATVMNLKRLITETPGVFYDVVMKARDESYELFNSIGDIRNESPLLEPDGSMRQDIRNIIMSATDGDEGDMHIVDPIDRD